MPQLSFSNTKNKDIYYLLKTDIFDNFFLLETEDKAYVFLDSLEIEAFNQRNHNSKIESVSLAPIVKKVVEAGDRKNFWGLAALEIIKEFGLEKAAIGVSGRFPLDIADFLRQKGITLKIESPFRPEREWKTEAEKELIRAVITETHPAFQKIEEILSQSEISEDTILFEGKILTSEFLKKEVERVFFEQDLISSEGMIISSGVQTALPHHSGQGSIKPNQFIICDLFPTSKVHGYFADTTRTYVKGKVSKDQERIYQSVFKAQELAIQMVKPGVPAKAVHQAAAESFLKDGFDIGDKGFIHSLGHGLGLNVHESPTISSHSETILKEGHVITIEPALYYPQRGGVRIEDVVYVTQNGSENLTNYPKDLLIL